MNTFLKFVLRIAFTHLYKDTVNHEAHSLYESFFPKDNKQEPQQGNYDELKLKIMSYVNTFVFDGEASFMNAPILNDENQPFVSIDE